MQRNLSPSSKLPIACYAWFCNVYWHTLLKLDADLEGKDIVISPAAGRGGGGGGAGKRGGGAEGAASGLFPPVAYFLAACAVNTQQAAKLPCEFECWQ